METALIRLIRAEDDPAVAAIIRSVMTEHGAVGAGFSINDPEVDAMYASYQAPGARFWVVEQGGRVQGCGGFAALAGGPGDTCELRKMYFLKGLRGRGQGAALLRLCVAEAARAGYRRMYLETLDSMQAARMLYARHGFSSLDGPLGNTGHCGCNHWMALQLGAAPAG